MKNLALATAALLAFWLLNICYGVYFRAAFPVQYSGEVSEASSASGLDEALIYAVIRTESGFRPDAQSSVGACGLMQITPDTLSWVRYRLGESGATETGLLWEPEQNIYYGAQTLALLIDEFGGVETALAAYHAGWGNVTKWLADERYSSDGETLAVIPFGDTSYYVSKVLETASMYKNVYHELK